MKILYISHIENMGWTDWKSDGKISGTVGSALRMEAIKIKLEDKAGLDIQMEYQAYVENIGWQPLKSDGQTAGTTGEGLRLEALRIRLVGGDSDKYELKYRLHVENIGWQLWKTSGETAGTIGTSLRAEAIELRLVLTDPNKTVPDGTIVETDPETGEPKVDPITGIPLGKELTIGYETHVEDVGWSKQVAGGLLSGRVGQSLRMEAIRIMVLNKGILGLGIEYQAHVENVGWQAVANNNATAGTTDQGLRLEALRIRLTGTDANKYSVWYRVHVENEGWQDWRRDWEVAGTTGQALRAEAIYILIAEKNKNLTRIPTLEPTMSVNYRTHIQNQDWTPWVKNGRKSGTSGMALRMEAFEMKLSALDNINLGVRYQAHCQNIGWQGWKTENQTAGTIGQSLRLEAIMIELTGEDANKYQVQYRVHLENTGWSDWAINGGIAGSEGESRRLEAISVVITKKALATQSTTNEIKNKVPYYQVFATEFPNREYLLHDLRTENKLIELVKTEGENKVDSLTFTIDPTHEHYHVLKELKTTILVYAEYSNQRIEKVFEGRIVQEETDYNNIKKVTCEGELGYLRDGIQRPGKYENLTNEQWLTMVLDGYNQSVTADRRFYMGIVTLENGKLDALRENDYINTLDLINDALINELGGYLQIEQIGGFRFLNYLENFGQVSTQAVEFGKNLLDLKKSSQSLDIISALIPIGKTIDDKKLGIADVNNNADYIYNETLVNRYGWIFGHKEWEEIDDAEILKQKGYEYLEVIANRGLTLELTALDLSLVNVDIDQIKVGDALRCVSKPHNIDTFLVVNHKTLDLNDPAKDKIVMGDEVATLTGSGGISGGGGFKNYIIKTESEEMTENTIKDGEETGNEIIGVIDEKVNAVFGEIEADRIIVGEIIADVGRFEHLFAGNITAENIAAGTITSTEIAANTITANEIKAGTITSDEIMARTITAGQIMAGTITAESGILANSVIGTAQIANSSITDGKIVSLTAEKIISGIIDTSKVTVLGHNGKLRIANNRLQVFDNSTIPKERVSLGDVNGNGTLYGFRVRGADGTTILYDETGVKREGITDGSITNSKISGDAEINGTKLLDNSISGGKLVINTITAREIASNVITSNHILTGSLTSASGIFGTMDASVINSGTINAARLNLSGYATFTSLSTAGQTIINGSNITTGTIQSTNYVYNSQGTKLYLNTGVFDTKNFKINSVGDVQVKGDLELGGTNAITIKNNSNYSVGQLKYISQQIMGINDRTLNLHATDVLYLSAGVTTSTSALVLNASGRDMITLGRVAFNKYALGMSIDSNTSLIMNPYNTLTPKLTGQGSTLKKDFSSLGFPSGVTAIFGRENSVVLNGLGFVVTMNINVRTDLSSSARRLITLPAAFRPPSQVTSIAFLGIQRQSLELSIHPDGQVILSGTSLVQLQEYIYANVTWYVSESVG